MKHMIRLACSDDIPAMLNIYAPYIDTDISFEYKVPSLETFRKKVETIKEIFPYLALEQSGKLTGYAYAQRVREREAYQWSAELSIYLEHTQISGGLGSSLYLTLMELLKLQGIRTVYGAITQGNGISLRFHEKLGFEHFADFRSIGYKNGRWLDVHWVQKQLAPFDVPEPLIKFSHLDRTLVQGVLDLANTR